MPTVNLAPLQEVAKRLDKELKLLPIVKMREELGRMGITLYPEIQNKDIATHFERKGGILRPYTPLTAVTNQDVGKALESVLEVKTAYASVKDNIKNYQTVAVGPDDLLGKNVTKKHPWERVMIWAIVSTFGEDLLEALFAGARVDGGTSPLDAFDGFDTKITAYKSAGEITTGKHNLVATGDISDPSDNTDTDAFDQLLDFWESADPSLRRANSLLYLPFDIASAYNKAFFNKFKYKSNVDEWRRIDLEGSGGKCKIVPSDIMGTGNRIILTIPGNFHLGMNSQSDDQFVQVREPYEDPNIKQFWIQGDYGTRILSINKKVFQTNDGTPIAASLAGDYDSGASS